MGSLDFMDPLLVTYPRLIFGPAVSRLLLLLLLLLVGCGSHVVRPSSGDLLILQSRVTSYASWTPSRMDPSGFILEDQCDALLWSSLTAVGRNVAIEVESAEAPVGQWFRLPLIYGDVCGPNEISRDMLMGLLVYILHFRRLDLATSLWSWGVAHDWKMNEGDDRTIVTPSFVGILARIIHHLGGPNNPESVIPDITIYSSSSSSWFGNQLQMLRIYLDGEMVGKISDVDLYFLSSVVRDSPGNILGQILRTTYTTGDQSGNISKLLQLYPIDRLPDDRDWCDVWRWERRDGDQALLPCPGTVIHSGGDFLFAAHIILTH